MVAIKDMEMPKGCVSCNFCTDDWCCKIQHKYINNFVPNHINRDPNCPLVEIEERKIGKWLVKDNGNGGKYVECPFCGALAPCTEFADRTVWKYSKFCYDCGNELRGTENE